MNPLLFSLALSLLTITQNAGTPAVQPAAPGAPRPEVPEESACIRLRHAAPDSVAKALEQVLRVNVASVRQPACVIVRAPKAIVTEARDLIAQLDQPGQPDSSDSDVGIFRVHHMRAEDATRLLAQVCATGSDMCIATDESRGRLIVRGSPAVLAQVTSLIKQLDVPAQSAAIDFTLIGADSAKTGSADDLPEDLREVGKELTRFGKLQLLGRLHTAAYENQPFQIGGSVASGVTTYVKGQLQEGSEPNIVRLVLEAEATYSPTSTPSDRPAVTNPRYNVRTTIIVRRGEYAAVGVAPAGGEATRSTILVVRAR